MTRISLNTQPLGDIDITFLRFDLQRRDLRRELSFALAECDRMVGLDRVARQAFFLSPGVDPGELSACVEKAYGRPAPPTSYIHQPPAAGQAVTCEIWAFSTERPLRRFPNVTAVETPSATWGFVSAAAGVTNDAPGAGTRRVLNRVQRDLLDAGLDFGHTVRTWYYIGDILGAAGDGNRYERFNETRNACYRELWPDLCLTPASTGIGMSTRGVVFEGLVMHPHGDDVQVNWLDNPLQTPPHLYDIELTQARKPSFSRAAAVGLGDATLTLISGTASIRQSRVLHPDSPVAQTETTIENLAVLVGEERLSELQNVRVYVKRREDVPAVRDCCRALLAGASCSYLIADVCKSDCLVEIEAVHVSPVAVTHRPAERAGVSVCAGSGGLALV